MNYKDYEFKRIGNSDYASLILVGYSGTGELINDSEICPTLLPFGRSGTYHAYLVDDKAEIDMCYDLFASFNLWLKVYDDHGLAFTVVGEKINVYRTGEMGCIIQVYEKMPNVRYFMAHWSQEFNLYRFISDIQMERAGLTLEKTNIDGGPVIEEEFFLRQEAIDAVKKTKSHVNLISLQLVELTEYFTVERLYDEDGEISQEVYGLVCSSLSDQDADPFLKFAE